MDRKLSITGYNSNRRMCIVACSRWHVRAHVLYPLVYQNGKNCVTFSPKIVLRLSAAPVGGGRTGPVTSSRHDYIRFSFQEGGKDMVSVKVTTFVAAAEV